MPATPRLITHLLDRARSWGWTTERLAKELGVDRTTLAKYVSGDRKLSMRTFASILRAFGDDRVTTHLAIHYATVEFNADDSIAHAGAAALHGDPAATTAIARYVERFADETLHGGRGLFITSTDTTFLTEAVRFIEQAFGRAGVRMCRLRADRSPSASEVQSALAAALLIVERADFTCDAVADVVERRANLVRPIVATSAVPAGALTRPPLQRLFTSMTHGVDLGPLAALPSGALPATGR